MRLAALARDLCNGELVELGSQHTESRRGRMFMERGISALGLLVMVGLAWLMSAQRRRVNWRLVAMGLLLQFAFAWLTLKTEPGQLLFDALGRLFSRVLDFVDAGASFVFGKNFKDFYFAFRVLPTIIFFSSLMSVLYYLGVMQRVVKAMAWVMQRAMGTSGAESLSAAANIFVGQTEAPLVIRPYIARMTNSELMAIMVGGFATIAGGVMAAYVGMGIDAGHLMTASVISAPAGLLIAKVLQPEVDRPETLGQSESVLPRTSSNVIEAAAEGASDGLKLALNVAAMLIAFLGLIAMLDWCLASVGRLYFDQTWSFATVLGYLFWPLAWVMGVPSQDCMPVGELLGIRIVANEFIAYEKLADWIKHPEQTVALTQRSRVLLTYALCGFANFGSIGIQIGGIGALAPDRRSDLARLGLRAMLGGTIACFMTACVAGVLL
ncbi:MAG TPA: NupC/NupG family nucleoside CNT transporter [Planctomycetaceae bacterium]|nr:NupC/NupG family nucleoside CNT transporter [Planctomycetaceae bacterium]